MRAILIANGNINNIDFLKSKIKKNDTIICVDGGLKYADEANILPDYIVGDFDSVSKELIEKYKEKDIIIKELDEEKDFTDLEIGIELAIELEISEILIFGGLGGRVDHSISNIMNLFKAGANNIKARIVDEDQDILILEDELKMKLPIGVTISLIPISKEVTEVETHGLKYPLNKESLYRSSSRGISNETISEEIILRKNTGDIIVLINKHLSH